MTRETPKWRAFLAVIAGLLAVASCGGGEDPGASNVDTGSSQTGDIGFSDPSQNADDGEDGGSLAPPDNLTAALPDGGSVTASISDTGYAYVYVEFSSDRYDEVVTFYNDWTTADSEDWSGHDSGFESQGVTVRGNILEL